MFRHISPVSKTGTMESQTNRKITETVTPLYISAYTVQGSNVTIACGFTTLLNRFVYNADDCLLQMPISVV